ncbi:MAG: Gfo/Idh/MocA family oxidoreductase [Clostridia bacterium]|nr:Gfo/Idh/MocA family oxidoreductase [Clostridia bacterium]
MNKIKFAIIGVGNMGTAHAKNLLEGKVENGELACLCDISAERREALKELFPNVPLFASVDEVIESGLADALMVSVPHYDHVKTAVKGFEAGLNVLVEKPAAVYTNDVLYMNEVAKKSGKTFGLMFNQRTSPAYTKLREMIKSGDLGRIKRVQWTITNWYRSTSYHNSGAWRSTWATEGGGALINQNPHQLDLMQWIFGMPSRIMSHVYFGKYRDLEVEDEATLFWEYDDGMTVTYITSTAEAPGTNRLEVACDMGRIIVENNKIIFDKLEMPEPEFDRTYTGAFGAPKVVENIELNEDIYGSGHAGIMQDFALACLENRQPALACGFEGINEMTISNACHLSTWKGNVWVDVKNFPHDEFEKYLREKIATSKPKTSVKAQVADTKGTY